MFNAIGHKDASDVFDITATTSPRSGNVKNEVELPSMVRLAWCAARVGLPASGKVSSVQPRPKLVSSPDRSGCRVWSMLTVAGFSSVPLLIAIPNRTRSDGVDRNAPAPAKQE